MSGCRARRLLGGYGVIGDPLTSQILFLCPAERRLLAVGGNEGKMEAFRRDAHRLEADLEVSHAPQEKQRVQI